MSQRGAPRIRQQLLSDAALGENFRDAQRGLDYVPLVTQRKIEMLYAEPLVLGNLPVMPESIEVMRVLDLSNQERPLHSGGLCHFVWRPKQGGAFIESVDGMSVPVNGGKKYRFTFRFSFAPGGGSNG